jgi:hypothetical protein
MIFASAYRIVRVAFPHSFAGLPAVEAGHYSDSLMLYFSFTTLTCTGFGDILPLTPVARSLANLEAIVGHLYPATLLATVVGLHVRDR